MDMIDVIKKSKLIVEGGMSDIHIGAQEVVGDYVDETGERLRMPLKDVIWDMEKRAKEAPFPESYEIETAIGMVKDKFNVDGSAKDEMPEPDEVMASTEPQATEPEAKEDMWGNTGTKAFFNMGSKLDIEFSMEQKGMMAGVLNRLDQDALLKAVDTYKAQELDPDQAESTELNTNTMTTEGKKQVNEGGFGMAGGAGLGAMLGGPAGAALGALAGDKLTGSKNKKDKQMIKKEAIQISTDSPEEAGMMMQLLKLAGVQQVDQNMISQGEPEADHEHGPECGHETDGDEMAKFRNMITAPDEEKAEETFDNEPDEKVADVDTLVNVHSGGLNKQKQQVRKEYPGDNPLAVKYETKEDTISEQDVANSLRAQYESFKKAYQESAKVAETKGTDHDKDGDIDSKDYMKSKDIAIKKAMGKKD